MGPDSSRSLRPRLGGLDVLKEMRRRKLKIPVLILSIFPKSDLRRLALKGGTAGYVNKQASPEGLIAAVRQALSLGESQVDSQSLPHICR